MANKPGRNFTDQPPRPPLVARNVNQYRGPVEAFDRMAFGSGLGVQWLPGGIPAVRSTVPVGTLVRARIGTDGMTARTGSDPTWTCGEGQVRRYYYDGPTRKIAGENEAETAYNDYPVEVDGDRDGWFAEIGGSLYLVIQNCTAD